VKIIPVIDVLGGRVVHAVRGRRKEYQPLKSKLCASTDPVDVAEALKALGFGELYVADLDAITRGQANFSIFKNIANKTGLALMVDAGIDTLKKAESVLESHVSKVIIGTETLPSVSLVAEVVRLFGSEKVMVSLDLMGDRLISGFELGARKDPVALLRAFQEAGVSQIIVLDFLKGSAEEHKGQCIRRWGRTRHQGFDGVERHRRFRSSVGYGFAFGKNLAERTETGWVTLVN